MSPSSPADAAAVLRAARARALSRPWLLAPPLAGALAHGAITASLSGDAAPAIGTLVGAAATVAACAAFAELWLAEGGRPDWGRVGAALVLYVIPMAALGVVGLGAAELFSLAFRASSASAARVLLVATFVAAKLASGAATIFVSLALARWSRERGWAAALREGAGLFAGRAAAWLALALASWAAQEAMGVALGFGLGAAARASAAFFQVFGLLGDALVAAIALAACIALPLQAAAEPR
jgi:hypothetical protein